MRKDFFDNAVMWEHAGFTCALRHGMCNIPCGYVLLPKEHPFYNAKDVNDDCFYNICVHGGITWCEKTEDGMLAVGFDMGHCYDFENDVNSKDFGKCVRTDDECIMETNKLAEQLATKPQVE